MPLVSISPVFHHDAYVGIWEMTESPTVFSAWYDEASRLYKSTIRQKEYVCVRALLHAMVGRNMSILHNGDGKPYLENGHQISVSHTKGFCAVILSKHHPVGIDIEYMSDRVGKIAGKFIREDEKALSTVHQLLHWCGKETVYKLFSSDQLEFFEMKVEPFELSEQGVVSISNLKRNVTAEVEYVVQPQYVLTYSILY